jgi:cupin 2 domain-containing protein
VSGGGKMQKGNLLHNLPLTSNEELFDDIIANDKFRLERIVSYGQKSPENFWYEQETAEWVILLEGKATILFEENNQEIPLLPFDYILIPSQKKHRVIETDPNNKTVWLAIHYNL